MSIEDDIQRLVERYDSDEEVQGSGPFADGGLEPLFPRLSRAAGSQVTGGHAAFSRYAIWANTVRDNLRAVLAASETGDHDEARRLIRRSINALSAFSEIQALMDSLHSEDETEQ